MNNSKKDFVIIIPVYNAYEHLVACVESVLKHTDLDYTNLVLVDDYSSDDRILPYLKKLEQENPHVLTMHNEKNMGFPATVNRAVKQTTGDIILLNSDTIVTSGWLERLAEAAYQDPSVGTVTPMSNHASHCTVPFEKEVNTASIERLGARLHQVSLRERPEIGTGIGFCMFIKRKVWEETGELDAEAYGKGYGEEVDFCLRSRQLGYRHILCDGVFVYHKGTASFDKEEKSVNLISSNETLHTRYGAQMENMLRTAEQGRNSDWIYNAGLYMAMENNKKNLLYLTHYDFRPDAENNMGGTQFHVKDLTMGLCREYNVFVAARDGEYLRLTAYIETKRFSFKFHIGEPADYPVYYQKKFETLYENILSAFEIDLVHIHHTFSLTLDLYRVAHRRGIPLIATLHDFYTVCPSINLLKNNEQLCIGKTDPESCKLCLKRMNHFSPEINFLEKWRSEHSEALKLCDILIVPSENTKQIILSYYPELNKTISVIEHGYDCPKRISDFYSFFTETKQIRFHIESSKKQIQNGEISGWCYLEENDSAESRLFLILSCNEDRLIVPVLKSVRDDVAAIDRRYRYSGFSIRLPTTGLYAGTWTLQAAVQNGEKFVVSSSRFEFKINHISKEKKFNVAFVGGLNTAKGSQIAYSMIKHGSKNINWFIFGNIDDQKLSDLRQKNLFKIRYQREDLYDLFDLYQIDLVCLLPICPETFCYTLSEAIVCGRPVLVTDLGAVADRVREMECGWIVPPDADTQQLLDKVEEIRNNTQELTRMTAHIKELHHKSIDRMLQDYKLLYSRFEIAENNKEQRFDTRLIYEGYLLGEKLNGIEHIGSQYNNVKLAIQIDSLKNELQTIKSSKGYKAVLVFRRLKIPFKRQLKAILSNLYKL